MHVTTCFEVSHLWCRWCVHVIWLRVAEHCVNSVVMLWWLPNQQWGLQILLFLSISRVWSVMIEHSLVQMKAEYVLKLKFLFIKFSLRLGFYDIWKRRKTPSIYWNFKIIYLSWIKLKLSTHIDTFQSMYVVSPSSTVTSLEMVHGMQ